MEIIDTNAHSKNTKIAKQETRELEDGTMKPNM